MDASVAVLKAVSRQESAEFPPFLANHLPMVLVALDRLGAAPNEVMRFDMAYRAANGLQPQPAPVVPLTVETWATCLGHREREADFRRFFAHEVARQGGAATIAAYLPRLAPGIAGSALHTLMRLAYAVMEEDEAEIGTALGFWATTYLPLLQAGHSPGITTDPVAVLQRAATLPGIAEAEAESDLLWHNMRAVAAVPAFRPVVDWLIIEDDTLDRMAAGSLALFAGTMSFEALHAVTGCHWLRMLRPVAPDLAPLMRHFWVAIASLLPKMGFPALPSDADLGAWRATPCPDWAIIKARAIVSDDEHDHSLTFSAFEEWRRTGDPLYHYVAAKRVGLIA